MSLAAPLSDDLRVLYQDLILDHGRSPRNFRAVKHPTCNAQGNNPMCGDRVNVTARVSPAGLLEDIAFEGKGCAISIASASMMSEALAGKSVPDAHLLYATVHALCTGKIDADQAKAAVPAAMGESFDKLASLSGVRQFPVRVKCATLPWHALISCLDGQSQATTEK